MKSILLFCTTFISLFSISQNQIIWGTTSDVSTSNFGNNFPRIIKNGSGNPVISWSDNSDMFFARWNGSNFTPPIILNTNGESIAGPGWMGPDIASKGDTIFAVYKATPEADTNSHVWCTGSFDGGLTFNTPVRVDYIGNNICRFPTVTVDSQGNPIVGFMRFDPGFGNPRWVVSKSVDFGTNFTSDVLASGWSDPTSEVCDCCPSKIVSDGDKVIMPYRDNDSDIRDTWAGVSTDGGLSFPSGMDVDQQGWSIMACPSSGPDAVIVGDDLYTTYMSGATGPSLVSYNVSSISSLTGSMAIALDQSSPTNLVSQNFPRVDYNGGSMAFVWKQYSDGNEELAIQFTENINTGINALQEIVDINNVNGVDVMLYDGTIWVVWEDESSGTVKYKNGTYTSYLNIESLQETASQFLIKPNPSYENWKISGNTNSNITKFRISNSCGEIIKTGQLQSTNGSVNAEIDNSGLKPGIYIIMITDDGGSLVKKVVKL